jgi:metal-sulfur cluster biosynthetic enzyme
MTAEEIREVLRQVVDPELGVNIVDLGLVYGVQVAGDQATVRMTMTSPACPLGELLARQAEAAIRRRWPGARGVRVELVWEPPWEPAMMSAAARKQLGWGG